MKLLLGFTRSLTMWTCQAQGACFKPSNALYKHSTYLLSCQQLLFTKQYQTSSSHPHDHIHQDKSYIHCEIPAITRIKKSQCTKGAILFCHTRSNDQIRTNNMMICIFQSPAIARLAKTFTLSIIGQHYEDLKKFPAHRTLHHLLHICRCLILLVCSWSCA